MNRWIRVKEVHGVAVDPSGALYVAGTFTTDAMTDVEGVSKYVPSANPPVDSDSTATFALDESGLPTGERYGTVLGLAVGAGSSAGSLFVAAAARSGGEPALIKMNAESGENHRFAEGTYFSVFSVAADPTSGNLIVASSKHEALEFDGSAETVEAPLSRTVIESEFGKIGGIATDSAGDLYAAMAPPEEGNPLQVRLYGEPTIAPTVTATEATEVGSTFATLTGTVNPEGVEISECFFEWGETNEYGSYGNKAPCESLPPTDSEPHEVTAKISGLLPNGSAYHYRLRAKNTNGTGLESSTDEVLRTAYRVKTEPAEVTGAHTATLNAVVRPEGSQYTECVFEYGLASHFGYEQSVPCEPEAALIPPDSGAHAVKAELTGLQEGTGYRFRVKATNGAAGTREGEELTFETFGAPRIEAIRASGATRSEATIEAEIDPSGFETSYRFQWGPTSSYGDFAPASFEPIGDGTSAVRVSATLSGLEAASAYHYRVIATSTEGRETQSPDQTLETLDSCGLVESRCFEMVSPREPFAAEQPGRFLGAAELKYQAAEQPGALAYVDEVGQEDATRGAEIVYQGTRGDGEAGWSSAQLSPPITSPDRRSGTNSGPSAFLGFSPDLRCSVLGATQPLTEGPAGKAIIEAGGGNLYRRNPDGTYTLLTPTPPEALQRTAAIIAAEFTLIGMSKDCSKIVFATKHHYPGTGAAGTEPLYEWEAGSGLRSLAWVPTEGGGEEAVPETGGSARLGAVSEDGSRVFFSAERLAGALPEEVGEPGVFAREDGAHTTDVSASETLTPDEEALFQGATPGGQRVYFVANAGLTADSSEAGTRDLYEYDFAKPEGARLTDLSATEAEGGARVGGNTGLEGFGALVGAVRDGSHAYFVARGRLDPGRGPTLAENEAANTYSLYDHESASGTNSFVATVGTGTELERVTFGKQFQTTSRTSPDGRYLLFQSGSQVTAYDSHGIQEAYLYDAQAGLGEQATTCLSCRQDGAAPVEKGARLASGGHANLRYQPQSLVLRKGQPLAFFKSQDALAPGGTQGIWNLYEWSHGQVVHIASEAAATASPGTEGNVIFTGASADGTDLYFFADTPLNWENPEGRPQAWDARVGGGFPEPPPAPEPCDPASEGSCPAGSASTAPASPNAASKDFSGPGNVKPSAKGAANRCTSRAHQAKRLSARAKKLRRSARKLNRHGNRARALKLARKARRLARGARAQSKSARRCRARIRKSRGAHR